ncbi:MAG: TraB/GumN family protein [Steroidobacteraceae bacterium]
MLERRLQAIGVAFAMAAAVMASGSVAAEPALWTVSGGGNTVYLFGSVHMLPEGGFAIDGPLAEALADAGKVCLEIDLGAVDEVEMQRLTLARVIDPKGRDLFTLLGPDADKAKAAAAAAGLPLEPLAQFEPWFAGMMLSLLALQQHGFDIENGVERIVDASARAAGKTMCGFETADEQLALFDEMPAGQQIEFLLQSIEEAGEIEADTRRLLQAWRDGDGDALARLFDEDFAGYPELVDRLVYDRNARWTEQIAELLAGEDDVLVVVGAGHLVGERGVPALLAKRGFKVDRD